MHDVNPCVVLLFLAEPRVVSIPGCRSSRSDEEKIMTWAGYIGVDITLASLP